MDDLTEKVLFVRKHIDRIQLALAHAYQTLQPRRPIPYDAVQQLAEARSLMEEIATKLDLGDT